MQFISTRLNHGNRNAFKDTDKHVVSNKSAVCLWCAYSMLLR